MLNRNDFLLYYRFFQEEAWQFQTLSLFYTNIHLFPNSLWPANRICSSSLLHGFLTIFGSKCWWYLSIKQAGNTSLCIAFHFFRLYCMLFLIIQILTSISWFRGSQPMIKWHRLPGGFRCLRGTSFAQILLSLMIFNGKFLILLKTILKKKNLFKSLFLIEI